MRPFLWRRGVFVLCLALAIGVGGSASSLLGVCGSFTDVTDAVFCPFILEIFYLGITTGTTPTTFDPTGNVTRIQMAAFLSRTVDATLKRGSRRAAMNQFWTVKTPLLGETTVGGVPRLLQFDGADLWVALSGSDSVLRVRASDGRFLETWTGATGAFGVAVAGNRIVATNNSSPGRLYMIDPSKPAGAVTTVASNVGINPIGVAFDGARVWTADGGPPGSVSIITPTASIPWTVTTFSIGIGATTPLGAVFDGSNVWFTDVGLGTLVKLDSSGAILQTVTVGASPFFPAFDGNSIWVPNSASNSVSVVRASNGAVLQTLTGNGLNVPAAAAFDGERILVTNPNGSSVSLWKAADLTAIGTFPTENGAGPEGVCSDGVRFWVGTFIGGKLLQF